MANDFMNWRISTSLRLFGIPHKKNSAVTRTKGRRWPAGKREPSAFPDVSVFPVVETCILRFSLDFETGFRRFSAGQPTPSRQAKIFVKRERFSPHRHLARFFDDKGLHCFRAPGAPNRDSPISVVSLRHCGNAIHHTTVSR